MKPLQQRVLFLVVPLIVLWHVGDVCAQVDQLAIAKGLLSTDVKQRMQALSMAQRIQVEDKVPELRAALMTALQREGDAHVARYHAGQLGQPLPPLEQPELIGALSREVAELRDPQAIPALTAALGTGFTVIRALAAFGEQAAPAVLRTVTSPTSTHDAVDGALITLRFIVEGEVARRLSAGTLQQIRQAAQQRLTGKQYFTTLWYAIDLGMLLDDPELARIVTSFAYDPNEVVARGIQKTDLVEQTQKRAADRLAGFPPLPRP